MSNFFNQCLIEKNNELPNLIAILLEHFSKIFNHDVAFYVMRNSDFNMLEYRKMISLEMAFDQLNGEPRKNFKSNTVVEFNTLMDRVTIDSMDGTRRISIMLDEGVVLKNVKFCKNVKDIFIIEFKVELHATIGCEVKIELSDYMYSQYLQEIYSIFAESELNIMHNSICAIANIFELADHV